MSDTCPDCHQPLDQPQQPCGYLGRHEVWCATCEADGRARMSVVAENESWLGLDILMQHFAR
jgi:hypothetical protein